ncbi:MAG: VIT1/CCC1 transporter family protein [Promethearchaeota archaeon]
MFERAKTYAKITDLWGIARRYFVNNFYDGMLTVLGILLGFFVLILKEDQSSIDSHLVILTGIGSSISMLISGMSGSYLSEKAEQKKMKEELYKAMVIDKNAEEEAIKDSSDVKEIEKAMLTKINHDIILRVKSRLRKKKKKIKNLQEKAESFASIIVSIINGGSPFLGGIVPLIPFFLVSNAGITTFIISFFIILFCIVLLGVFLGIISKESIVKNICQMFFAFFITLLISIFLLS